MKEDQKPSLSKALLQNKGIAVEIGTWEGDFSWELLNHCNFTKVYCVDPYKHFTDESYPDGMNDLTQEEFNKKFETVKNRFKQFGNRVEFLRMTSQEAASLFEEKSINFIYIDGNHDKKAVVNDIQSWWSKIKIGGFCAGDDIYSTDINEHDSDGNVSRVWEWDSNQKPTCWGKYGTYASLVECSKIFNYTYTIEGTQFCIEKKL